MIDDLERRVRLHAALADPLRLTIVDELARSDRSPGELGDLLGTAGNLLAHHLGVLEQAGLVERRRSAGDGRRRYLRLCGHELLHLADQIARPAKVVFVCTHNSARSQLAAALWRRRVGTSARSAGTHPASRVHPGAVAAARRVGLDLSLARPSLFDRDQSATARVVTVCDRAHEELPRDITSWHWSIPDPVEDGTPQAFDAVVADIEARIDRLDPRSAPPPPPINTEQRSRR